MKKSTIRALSIVLFILVTIYFLMPLFVPNLPSFWTSKKLKLGLDLQGGMQIILYVDQSKLTENAEKQEALKTAVEVIRNRVDQFGVAEPSIQTVGTDKIVVQLPGLKEFNRAKELIGKTALLEFKLVATPEEGKMVMNKMDLFLKANLKSYPYLSEFDNSKGKPKSETLIKTKADSTVADSTNDTGQIFTNLTSSGSSLMAVSVEDKATVEKLLNDQNFINNLPAGFQLALGKKNDAMPKEDIPLYLLYQNAELTGEYLNDAQTKIGSGSEFKSSNKPYVLLKFNKEGAKKFERVTGQNIKKQLAVVLDGTVYVAPTIQDKIRGGEAQITGSFTMEECHDLVIVLKAGNLPAPVSIQEERTVGPTLGSDSIKSGIMAGLIGTLAVILFMMIYYGFSGVIADCVLIINIGFVLAALTFFRATLTMPGIAGLILSVGMAVDANVLIFERIREEIRHGKTIRNAVDTGFARAMVTIIDSNLTTLITALVLYQFGTGPIRGFAVTLSIGILASMFTAIVMSRAIFDNFITNKTRKSLSI